MTSLLEDVRSHISDLSDTNVHATIHWVRGHSDLTYNEKADSVAKAGCNLPQNDVPIDFTTAKTVIR